MRRLLRVGEEEIVLVILLVGFAVVFLSVFPPQLLVNDSFLTLTAGREIVENGLPHRDELTVIGAGRTWTDQQWGAQLLAYGAYELDGHASLALVVAVVRGRCVRHRRRGSAFARSRAARNRARVLPGDPRRPLGVDDPRAGIRAPALHRSRLAARVRGQAPVEERLPRDPPARRLGESPRERRARRAADHALRGDRARLEPRTLGAAERGAARPRAARGPGDAVRPRRDGALLPADAPRSAVRGPRHRVAAERPGLGHARLLLLAALAVGLVVWGRKRLAAFDIATLALTFAGAVLAIRGIPWFALSCMVLLPVAIGTCARRDVRRRFARASTARSRSVRSWC